jgi:IS5 family transposase
MLPDTETPIADKGYDSDAFREALAGRGITPCIPPRAKRRLLATYCKTLADLTTTAASGPKRAAIEADFRLQGASRRRSGVRILRAHRLLNRLAPSFQSSASAKSRAARHSIALGTG